MAVDEIMDRASYPPRTIMQRNSEAKRLTVVFAIRES
jgi:hypothetical protein